MHSFTETEQLKNVADDRSYLICILYSSKYCTEVMFSANQSKFLTI